MNNAAPNANIAHSDSEGIRKSMLRELDLKLTEVTKALDGLRGVLLGQGFVVVSAAGIALKYDIDPKTKSVRSVAQAGGAANATRFVKSDADNVAAATIDGRATPATAMHVTDALRAERDRIESVIAMIKAA